MKKLLLTIGVISSIATPLFTTIACGDKKADKEDTDNTQPPENESNNLIPEDQFNHYKETLTDQEIAISIIDVENDQWWASVIPWSDNTKLYEVMNITETYQDASSMAQIPDEQSFSFLGEWTEAYNSYFIKGYKVGGEHTDWQDETNVPSMFTWDVSNLGSGIPIQPATLYQFSYR